MILISYLVNIRKCQKFMSCYIRWNSLEYFSNIHQNDVADLKIVLSNLMQPSCKIKKLRKRDVLRNTMGGKKTMYLKTFRRFMSHCYNVLKYYINKWLGQQQCYSGVGTFKINNKLHFHRCFSHNRIFFWFYPQFKLDIARFWMWYPYNRSNYWLCKTSSTK